jgi:hypothetical protein
LCKSYATIQFGAFLLLCNFSQSKLPCLKGHYQQFAAIQCATSILLAIGKPLFAKLTDAAGRAEVYLFWLANPSVVLD